MPHPYDKPRITQPWGKPNPRYKAGRHTGIDYGVPIGTPTKAVASGLVISVLKDKSYGNVVVVKSKHEGKEYQTWYCHLNTIAVKPRESVVEGQVIAMSGNTGNSTGPHLHLETRVAPFRYGSDVATPFIDDPKVAYGSKGVEAPKVKKPIEQKPKKKKATPKKTAVKKAKKPKSSY
jgi:murein DD-endopeptidase MepM/ murein hydrolase activator NlpD